MLGALFSEKVVDRLFAKGVTRTKTGNQAVVDRCLDVAPGSTCLMGITKTSTAPGNEDGEAALKVM